MSGRFAFLDTGNGRPLVYVDTSHHLVLCGPCAAASHAGGSTIALPFTLPYSEPRDPDDYCQRCDECLAAAHDRL